jgi:hypothetical protein
MSSIIVFLTTYGNDIRIALTTLFGSAGMYVFASHKGFDNSINFFKRMFPNHSETFYYRFDFVLMTVAGALIGLISFSPTGTYEALAAGFGWTGAMNVLLKTDPP